MIAEGTDLRSTGQICADLQRPHGAIVRAIERLGIRPTLRLNGLAHYDEAAVTRIYAELQAEPSTSNQQSQPPSTPRGTSRRGH